ncbi:tigger transposable element-derived protein 2-like [Haliotis rufescens]|uniref:tigger transposable element-derived protein 2-like n=1 Tax=Haliotis rufescens TaxID=6454 RepID=UPI00201EDF84|nr:tigger transposable element-derived protein 2-like [Haliotis rufescens]
MAKRRKKLQDLAFETQEIGGLQKKRNKGATDSALDAALFEWFTQSRNGGIPLSGEIVKMQAQKLSQDIHGPDDTFKASAGWLWRFQKRHGIKSFTVTGERRSADDDAANTFPAILRELIKSEGYDFVPAVHDHLRSRKLEEKAILLLDNCPAHPPASTLQSHDGLIKAFLLLKNTTSLIQPLDQEIIKACKAHYRRFLVNALVERGLDPVAFLQTVTVKNAVLHTDKAWMKVTPATINNCWMKGLGPAFGVDDIVGFQEEDVIDAD